MPSKKSTGLVLVGVAVIIGLGLWWLLQLATVPAEKAPPAITSSTSAVPQPITLPTQVAPPTAAPALSKPGTATSPPDSSVSQAELNTAIQDIARLLRDGGKLALMQAYTPPGQLDNHVVQRLQQQQANAARMPDLEQQLDKDNEAMARAYEALENQTPTLNTAGDEATYKFILPGLGAGPDVPIERVFVRIDGKWYLN